MSDWEDEALEDAFPQVGTTYYLRPQGEPVVKLYSKRDGGEYKKLKCTFWSYPKEEVTAQSHFKVLCVTVYPGTIAEFAGKWQNDRVYKTTCQLDGKKKFLHIQSATLIRDAPPDPPAPPQRQGPGPISPGPPAEPQAEQGAKPCPSTAAVGTASTQPSLPHAVPGGGASPAVPSQGDGAKPCPHMWTEKNPLGMTICSTCFKELQYVDGRWQ